MSKSRYTEYWIRKRPIEVNVTPWKNNPVKYAKYLCVDLKDGFWSPEVTDNVIEKRAVHEALGWLYAEACAYMDQGKDIREIEVPEIIERACQELGLSKE